MLCQCRIPVIIPIILRAGIFPTTSSRSISSTFPVLAGRKKKNSPPPVISKKKQQAKERKRVLKRALREKNKYESEQMSLSDAISVLRAVEIARPNATYELVIRTWSGKNAAALRGRISLPFTPKPAKLDSILVFAEGRAAEEAKRAGADIVGGLELVDGIISGRHQANIILSTPELVKAITPKLGRILGPKGLMPTERRGTATEDPASFIKTLKGSSEWKSDKAGTVRGPIGKLRFPPEHVIQNVRHYVDVVKKGVRRGDQSETHKQVATIRRVILSSQQGPGITISDVA